MSKTITSPVKHFPGTVTLHDPLDMTQAVQVEDAIQAIRAMDREKLTMLKIAALEEPAILACVEKWNLAGLADNPTKLPATPRKSSAELFSWLWTEISALFEEAADEVPND